MTETPAVEYDAERGSYRVEFDPADVRPMFGVVSLFDAVEKAESIDLPPLYDVVDYDALDTLVRGQRRNAQAERLTVECVTHLFRLRVSCVDRSTTLELRLEPK